MPETPKITLLPDSQGAALPPLEVSGDIKVGTMVTLSVVGPTQITLVHKVTQPELAALLVDPGLTNLPIGDYKVKAKISNWPVVSNWSTELPFKIGA